MVSTHTGDEFFNQSNMDSMSIKDPGEYRHKSKIDIRRAFIPTVFCSGIPYLANGGVNLLGAASGLAPEVVGVESRLSSA